MTKWIVGISFALILIFGAPGGNAEEIPLSFAEQFDSAVIRSVYGEAEHFISVRWTVNSLSVSTDLFGGRTVSDFNLVNRLYLLSLLDDMYREKIAGTDDSCYRTWVEATFYRGKDNVIRRACLFPSDRGLAKKVLDFFEAATLAM
jgi:hypothetical protein